MAYPADKARVFAPELKLVQGFVEGPLLKWRPLNRKKPCRFYTV